MEAYYLITYYYINGESYHYKITSDVEAWVAKSQSHYPDIYVLINVLPISKKFASEWDGSLYTM